MLDQLINGLKDQLGSQITQEAKVDSNQMDGIMSVLGDVTKKEVVKEMTGGGIAGLMNLFSNSSNNSAADSIQNNITSGIVESLMHKVGINGSTAKMIAGTAVPMVMNLITKENNTTPDDDPSPIAKLFSNDDDDGSSLLGSIMGKLF